QHEQQQRAQPVPAADSARGQGMRESERRAAHSFLRAHAARQRAADNPSACRRAHRNGRRQHWAGRGDLIFMRPGHLGGKPGRVQGTGLLVMLCALSATIAIAVPQRPVVEPAERDAPLVLAVRARDFASARALLSAKPRPDVNQRTSDGTTTLHWAVYHDEVDLVERLVAAGADVNAKNDYGSTPLSEAAVIGNVKVIRRLLKAGADVESPNDDGQTALMILSRTSNVEAAKLLISHGANVNVREQWRGQTPRMR